LVKTAKEVIEKFDKMEGDKSPNLNLWQEIGEFCYPSVANFTRYYNKGERRGRLLFDGTAERSLEIFAASLIGLIANPTSKWIDFQPTDQKLSDDRSVKEFVDEARTKVLAVFNNPNTKFYDNLFTVLQMIGAYGTGCLFIDEDKDHIAKFRAESPKGLNFTEDFSGGVEEVYFNRKYRVDQLQGDDWDLPEDFKRKKPDDMVQVLRVIYPNKDYDPTKMGRAFAKYHSCYYLKDEQKLIKESYFDTMPAPIGRWGRLDDEKWGDSPARVALSEVKLINVTQKGVTVAMEKRLKPTIIVSSEAKFGKFDTTPGQPLVARGNVNDAIKQLDMSGDVGIVLEWQELIRQAIRSSFYVDVFQSAERIDMTATEANIRYASQLRIVAPRGARIQSDILGPAAERVLDMLIRQGKIVVPRALKNTELRVTYVSPLAQAQRSQEGQAMVQYIQELGMAAQFKPSVLDWIDEDGFAKELASIRGVPEKMLKVQKDVDKQRKAQQDMATAQQTLALTQQAGEAGQAVNAAENG
jgi:hypothetical protein